MRIIYEPRGRALEYAPLAVNLYKGCAHGCLYCFGPKITKTEIAEFVCRPHPREGALKLLEMDARDLARIHDPREILMSFTTDPYQPIEEQFGLTRAAIGILLEYGLKFTILTKGGLRSLRDLDLLIERPDLFRYGTTLVFRDESEWEPFAAPTHERIAALRVMHDNGIPTWVSCEPVFDIYQTIQLIEISLPFVDEYRIGKLNHYEARITPREYDTLMVRASEMIARAGKRCIFKKDLLEAAYGA